MARSVPTEDWAVTNGHYYSDAATSFGITSGSKFAGAYSASITNPYLYVINNGSLIDNKISDPIAIKAQFYPSSTHSIITRKNTSILYWATGKTHTNNQHIPKRENGLPDKVRIPSRAVRIWRFYGARRGIMLFTNNNVPFSFLIIVQSNSILNRGLTSPVWESKTFRTHP